jgi:hypothetical protein
MLKKKEEEEEFMNIKDAGEIHFNIVKHRSNETKKTLCIDIKQITKLEVDEYINEESKKKLILLPDIPDDNFDDNIKKIIKKYKEQYLQFKKLDEKEYREDILFNFKTVNKKEVDKGIIIYYRKDGEIKVFSKCESEQEYSWYGTENYYLDDDNFSVIKEQDNDVNNSINTLKKQIKDDCEKLISSVVINQKKIKDNNDRKPFALYIDKLDGYFYLSPS